MQVITIGWKFAVLFDSGVTFMCETKNEADKMMKKWGWNS